MIKDIRRIKQAIADLRKRKGQALSRGLVKAGLTLQRESQKIVPIDTGALRDSAFTRKEEFATTTIVIVGYSVYYAIYVHEDLFARHAPGKYAKYLTYPLREMEDQLRDIVMEEVRKG